jgi:hypothetical protein
MEICICSELLSWKFFSRRNGNGEKVSPEGISGWESEDYPPPPWILRPPLYNLTLHVF